MELQLTFEIQEFNTGKCVGRCLEFSEVMSEGKNKEDCKQKLQDDVLTILAYKRLGNKNLPYRSSVAEVGEMIVPKPHSSTNACYSTKVS